MTDPIDRFKPSAVGNGGKAFLRTPGTPICIDCRDAPQREYFRCWACLAAWRRKTEG